MRTMFKLMFPVPILRSEATVNWALTVNRARRLRQLVVQANSAPPLTNSRLPNARTALQASIARTPVSLPQLPTAPQATFAIVPQQLPLSLAATPTTTVQRAP